ncbi:hypothetical protein IV498_07055 [Paenarthrobacter sp. Z7-10]|uniref:hypothetical protein n=1 Tax=Paenarthrobacter sp. Z7-10 TaxID=2787635 RepID=UPI0022A8D816|nr:hypothetical protein [Paenarthrobacter sp. Z7-10]MCZ2402948.1 hypothetical protein [Paenarthrobacter sp. Z7-10]
MKARSAISISVLLGTDHHPFSRLVTWADTWAAAHPADSVTVQYGHSFAPSVAVGHSFLSPRDLDEVVGSSDIVITHGGPASISSARAAGHLPLVLARDPRLGEHVDDHQQRFARWSGERSLINCVDSVPELDRRVDELQNLDGTRIGSPAQNTVSDDAVGRIPRLLAKARAAADWSSPGAPVALHVTGLPPSAFGPQLSALKAADGVLVLGDVGSVWEEGIVADSLCSCGVSFSECDFWIRTGETAFGGWDKVDLDRVNGLRKSLQTTRNLALSALPFQTPALRRKISAYTGYYQAMYQAARDITGARMLVCLDRDSALAIALSHNREIDVRMLRVTANGRESGTDAGTPRNGEKGPLFASLDPEAARMRHIPHGTVTYSEFVDGKTGGMRIDSSTSDVTSASTVPQSQHLLLRRASR